MIAVEVGVVREGDTLGSIGESRHRARALYGLPCRNLDDRRRLVHI